MATSLLDFGVLGRDDVPPLDPLVALGDVDEAPSRSISSVRGEELADPQAAPVQDLERVEVAGLSMTSSLNMRYCSFVQNFISEPFRSPILIVGVAGLLPRP